MSYHVQHDVHVHPLLVDVAAAAADIVAAVAAVAVADIAVVVEVAVGIVAAAVVWHAVGIVDIEHSVADIVAVVAVDTVDIVRHDPINTIINSSFFLANWY